MLVEKQIFLKQIIVAELYTPFESSDTIQYMEYFPLIILYASKLPTSECQLCVVLLFKLWYFNPVTLQV